MSRLLDVRDLTVSFGRGRAVDGISFTLDEGETLGLVGESGCGKSTTALAIMGLLRGAAVGGSAVFEGQDLFALDAGERRNICGARIGMIFQDPGTSLHPLIRVGDQVADVLRRHRGLTRSEARREAARLFGDVGIAAPERRLDAWPHELSGGMCQRVMIAQAIACGPRLLLTDEPTTALDVTVQAQILELIDGLRHRLGMAVLLITHDLGVVAGQAARVAVMYAGRVVETAATDALFAAPAHPYTRGLLAAVPDMERDSGAPLATIPGGVGDAAPAGACAFLPRCSRAAEPCVVAPPLAGVRPGHDAACWFAAA